MTLRPLKSKAEVKFDDRMCLCRAVTAVSKAMQISFEDAWVRVRRRLRLGEVKGYGFVDRTLKQVPADEWISQLNDRAAQTGEVSFEVEHDVVQMSGDMSADGVTNRLISNDFWSGKDARGHTVVQSNMERAAQRSTTRRTFPAWMDVAAVSTVVSLENAKPETTAPATTPVAARAGGRPPKPGHDEFWIEAARRVLEGNRGIAQADFVRLMAEWATENMTDRYSSDTVEAKIKKLWRTLRLSGG